MKRKCFRLLLFDLDVGCQLHVHHLISVYILNCDFDKIEKMRSIIDSMNYSEKVIP